MPDVEWTSWVACPYCAKPLPVTTDLSITLENGVAEVDVAGHSMAEADAHVCGPGDWR